MLTRGLTLESVLCAAAEERAEGAEWTLQGRAQVCMALPLLRWLGRQALEVAVAEARGACKGSAHLWLRRHLSLCPG